MDRYNRSTFSSWLYNTIFKDEAIQPVGIQRGENLPAILQEARSFEVGGEWTPRQSIFLKQGRFLADYEDDYEYKGDPVRYYPTYQSFTDDELRGYFSWRTKVRKGEFCQTSVSFIFLYIYELINHIGVESPMEGYEKLLQIYQRYGPSEYKIPAYLHQWLIDYVVYYNLDHRLLEDLVQVVNDQCVNVLENMRAESQDRIIDAVKQLAPKWLMRSRFYADNYAEMDVIICRTLQRIADHYATGFKKNMIEQFFGLMETQHVHIFSRAIFCNPLNRQNYEYRVDTQYIYKCEDGIWSVRRRVVSPRSVRKLEKLLKTVDSIMREEYGYSHPVKAEISVKWQLRVIREEIQAFLSEIKSGEKKNIEIDFSQLAKIREDAAVTQQKLIVEEETMAVDIPSGDTTIPSQSGPKEDATPLAPAEYRLLQCLLYNRDTGWLKSEGYLLSVLVDGINEKLYDIFEDTVIDDAGLLVEDYMGELKEMIAG